MAERCAESEAIIRAVQRHVHHAQAAAALGQIFLVTRLAPTPIMRELVANLVRRTGVEPAPLPGRTSRFKDSIMLHSCARPVVLGGECTIGCAEARLRKGDGSYVVCEDRSMLTYAGCQVVSVGSNGEVGFEKAAHAMAPSCRIQTWDGTLTRARASLRANIPSYVEFIPRNFANDSWIAAAGRTISILKMDCEGCEYSSLVPWLEQVCTESIVMELHPFPRAPGELASQVAPKYERTGRLLARLSESHEPFYGRYNPAEIA